MRKNGDTTAYRENLKVKIVETAIPLFKQLGIKAVKMDDIATELGISKRTLYEICSDKEELLYECVKHAHAVIHKQLSEYSKTTDNEMDIISYILRVRLKDIEKVNPLYFIEMHKYSKILSFIQKDKEKHKAESSAFLRRGVEHGFFRNDLDYDIVNEIQEATMDYVMRTRMYNKYPLKDIFRTLMIIYMRGCCTDKGLKYLENVMKDENGMISASV